MNRREWLAATALGLAGGCSRRASRVVLYCAQDREFAEGLLADFAAGSGLKVEPKFDTEAQKSVALAAELEQEAARPRCDVHWNNEILGTILLARKGVYEPYESPNAAPFPAASKSKDHTWQAFAQRARVLVINTDLVPNPKHRPAGILDLADERWRGAAAIAKPQHGTTATHAACLFEAIGPDAARAFFRGLKANGANVVAGNKQVARGVADGRFAVGVTDTDDALAEIRDGKPVAMVFPDRDGSRTHFRLGTLFVPNTVAVVKNAPNPGGARKLVDFLLRLESETRLAEGGGFQIPLNPQVKAPLPPELLTPAQVRPMEVDFDRAADLWAETQAFLRAEFGS